MSDFEEPVSPNVPSQETLEAGLANFKPRPSERFYRRMATAPWLVASSVTHQEALMNKPSKFFKLTMPVLVGLILVMGLAATPWGQALATEMFKLFVQADSNTFPLSPDEITQAATPPAETPEPLIYSARSVSGLETQLGFDIKEPTVLPDDFFLEGITVSGGSVGFTYQCHCGGRSLVISQQPLSDAVSVNVGVGTPIEKVQIGKVKGEYVEGSFVIYPGAEVATWLADAPMRRLRWVTNEMLFEIVSTGGSGEGLERQLGYVSKEEMIAIAEGLK